VPLVEYMIGRTLIGRELSTIEDRTRAVKSGLALVVDLEDPVRREEYARLLAGQVGEPERSVMLQMEHMLGAESAPPAHAERPAATRLPPDEEVEREVLKLLIQSSDLVAGWTVRLSADLFGKPTHRKAFELIAEWAAQGKPVSELLAAAQERGGEHLGRAVAAVAMEPVKSAGEPTPEYAERMLFRLEEFSLKRRADALRKELQRMNPVKSPEEYDRMFIDLAALEGARRRAREAAEAVGAGP
jgi:DNA primase